MPSIREELHQAAELWNLHRIRSQSLNRNSRSGRPDILYFLPELNGKINYTEVVPSPEVIIVFPRNTPISGITKSRTISNYWYTLTKKLQ